jgi:hypothetical protein
MSLSVSYVPHILIYNRQLMAVRQRLRGKVHVVVGENEQVGIAKLAGVPETDLPAVPQAVAVDQHVSLAESCNFTNGKILLRTVDNFQGEEAKVVILSLVRNAGSTEDGSPSGTIGFLKVSRSPGLR